MSKPDDSTTSYKQDTSRDAGSRSSRRRAVVDTRRDLTEPPGDGDVGT